MYAFIALTLLSAVSAGPHGTGPRRHHARHFPASVDSPAAQMAKRGCTDGAWQCAGSELQRCTSDTWVTVQDCTGENIVCSADSRATGCTWSWTVDEPAAASSSASDPASAPTAAASAIGGNLAVKNGPNGKTSTQDWYGQSASSTDTGSAASSTASGSTAQSTDWYAAPSSASQTSTSAASTQTAGGSNNAPSGQYSAPHYVIYADKYLSKLPSASELSNYNRFILAFWMTESGPVDNAQAWESFDASYRQQVLDEYHAAGIALMVSAFGSTDSPTTNGADPTATAQKLAAWVKQYGLDGVDIDYEDMSAMDSNQAESWLVTFQKELRNQLPEPFLISHAPVAPWFTSGSNYPGGAYVDVHKQAGEGISFYNIQFYNQGAGVYEDCNSLIQDSGSAWPDTSVMGINSHAGVPLDKIVIGKPIDASAASNGYMPGSTLSTCVSQAQSQGWNGGVMFWEWSPSLGNSLMATVRG